MDNLPNFKSVIVNHHRFVWRGSKSKYFTPGKKYEITSIYNADYSIHTIDDEGHTHTLGLNYFNQYCTLIDVPCEILELMDDLDDALIDKDPKKFIEIASKIATDLKESIAIKEDDIVEGAHFESEGQFIKTVMFDGKWIAIRQPKLVRTHSPMLESYDTKADLVKKLNNKEYKKIN